MNGQRTASGRFAKGNTEARKAKRAVGSDDVVAFAGYIWDGERQPELVGAEGSLTGDYLAGRRAVLTPVAPGPLLPDGSTPWLEVLGAAEHNLKGKLYSISCMENKRPDQTELSYKINFYGMIAIGVLLVILFLAKTFGNGNL